MQGRELMVICFVFLGRHFSHFYRLEVYKMALP